MDSGLGVSEKTVRRNIRSKPQRAPYDANSQVPTGFPNGRTVYYLFGRYPKEPDDDDYPVIALVLFHGTFLNATHQYVHENKHITETTKGPISPTIDCLNSWFPRRIRADSLATYEPIREGAS